MLRGREVVAVQEFDTVAGQQRGQGSPQGVDDRGDAPCGITDQCGRDGQLDVLELVVDRLVADRELVFQLTVGGMDGRLLSENDTTHQLDQGREEQFVGVLMSGMLCEQMVDVLRVEDSLQNSAGHDTDGSFLDKWLEDLVQQHRGFLPHRLFAAIYGRIVDVERWLPWKGWADPAEQGSKPFDGDGFWCYCVLSRQP